MSNEHYPAHMFAALSGKQCGGRNLKSAAEAAWAAGQIKGENVSPIVRGRDKAKRGSQTLRTPKTDIIGPKKDFLNQLQACGLPEPVLEYRLIPGRHYRGDFCWPEPIKLCCEYQGIFGKQNASHASIAGLMRDYRKTSMAQLLGWVVLLIDAESVKSGEAVEWVRRAFALQAERSAGRGDLSESY